jgi:hypothetical protein
MNDETGKMIPAPYYTIRRLAPLVGQKMLQKISSWRSARLDFEAPPVQKFRRDKRRRRY